MRYKYKMFLSHIQWLSVRFVYVCSGAVGSVLCVVGGCCVSVELRSFGYTLLGSGVVGELATC